jgi:hypothetical protein
MNLRTLALMMGWLVLSAWNQALAQSPDAKGLALFEQKIRPVLVQHCYSCHSEEAQEKKKLQAGLFLDSQEGLLNGGETGPAIVKGKSAESLLLKALKYEDLEMPPTGKLPEEVVADFAKWIDLGAPDPRQGRKPAAAKREIDLAAGRDFWSFKPLQEVTPPQVKNTDWVKTPIDHFISARHTELGLVPNGPVAKEKLIRRISFDLIGLPPTPEEVETFVNDPSPSAYEQLVDKLLASPRYGERWGRHWLDVVRYAESGGYEFDGFRPGAYHYRDWVIRALNDDMPHNEFVRMQLAGDHLLPGDYQGASAVGFLVAGPYPGQITAKTEERIRYDQLDDMIMTMGGSMLGLTLGCVRCHDHKYDPLPQQDYYNIAASLARTVHGARPFDPDPAATQRAVEKHAAEQARLTAEVQKFAREELPKRFETWQKNELPKLTAEPRWQILDPITASAEGTWFDTTADGLVVLAPSGRRKDGDKYVVTAQTFQTKIMALRLDALTDKSLPKKGPGLGNDGSFTLAEFQVLAQPLDPNSKEKAVVLELKAAMSAFEEKTQPLKNAVDRNNGTFWRAKDDGGKDNAAIFEIVGGLPGFTSGTLLTFELKFVNQGLGRFRLAICTEPNPATWAGEIMPQHLAEIKAMLAANKGQLVEAQRESMVRWFSRYDEPTGKVFDTLAKHIRKEPRPPLTDVYTSIAGGRDVFLLRRGEVDNKLDKAEPGFLQVLSTANEKNAHWLKSSNEKAPPVPPRLGLANWLTDADQGAGHLLARVMVNRMWHHHFGDGIVGTPNDFGAQGDRPSHPELLDWLARELIRGGWKLKPLHRQIVTSAAYMQGDEVSPSNVAIDPDNRYLWHRKPRRLEAEIIRDALLAIGNSLDATLYGPSVLDTSPRRSVYLRVKRSELIPFMTMFDAPEPTQSIGERVSTTVPTQALTMMNSPFVRQQAEKLAKRIRPTPDIPLDTAIDKAYQIVMSRHALPDERARMLAFVDTQKSMLPSGTPSNADTSLVEFCQVLLCLNEFIYVD